MLPLNSTPLSDRPCLVLGSNEADHAGRVGRSFHEHGWQVRQASTAAEVRRLVARFSPDAVILDVELPDESGWLTCAKLRLDHPERKVLLVADQLTADEERFADFLGAAGLVARSADFSPGELSDLVPACAAAE